MASLEKIPAQGRGDDWCLERVSGPHRGHFFGGYARRSPNGSLAYVKIFKHEPNTVWDSQATAKVFAQGAGSLGAALALAESRAKLWLELMHGPECANG